MDSMRKENSLTLLGPPGLDVMIECTHNGGPLPRATGPIIASVRILQEAQAHNLAAGASRNARTEALGSWRGKSGTVSAGGGPDPVGGGPDRWLADGSVVGDIAEKSSTHKQRAG